jgi:hypothetical protein
LTFYNAPQFFLLSDGVFAGTVQHIDNATDHQWKVYFTVDKSWRGIMTQKPLMVMTTSLQGCGYSIVQGEKYLVYTNGYPPFFNAVWSKPYADAQSDIAIINDTKFQSNEKFQEELNKKLENAKDAISNLMGSRMGDIPFNEVGVDEINSILDVGIDSTKATLSEEEYLQKIKEIVGDIPIKITFGIISDLTPIIQNNSTENKSPDHGATGVPIMGFESPLHQFKSGIAAKDVQCNNNMKAIIKKSDGLPACVKPESVSKLLIRGWAMLNLKDFGYNPGRGPVNSVNASENSCGQFQSAPQSHNSTAVPVLLMNSNSTACARLTFTIVSNYKDCNGHTCQGIIDFNSTLHIGNLHYEKHDNLLSISSGKDYTNSFQIIVVPQTVNLDNFQIGSNFTVTYMIRPLSNATGFYDQSIPKLACERYPLAVGYATDQVNYSNFSYIDLLNPPCASAGIYNLAAVEISGMSYKEVAIP